MSYTSHFWIRASELDSFVSSLIDALSKRYPPELDNRTEKHSVSVNRLTKTMEDTCQKAASFQDEKRLSWLGKSRLANRFRWALIEAGYTKPFVDFATEALVVHMTRSKKD